MPTAPSRDPLAPVTAPAWSEDELNQDAVVAEAAADLSLPWAFISLSEDGRKLRVAYIAGDEYCVQFAGFLVSQDTESVTLTATGRYTATPPPSACPAMLVQGAGTITLDEPLGTRDLIHAAVSPQRAFPPPMTDR